MKQASCNAVNFLDLLGFVFGFVFSPSFIFNNMAGFVLGSFRVRFFNSCLFSTTWPASFSGSIGFVLGSFFWPILCVQ